ncbi:MAG: hypothetical protein KDK70_09640 [Myxococcales bacterium]|nr:hypothetical protein [Myxococcales bacterium]
MHMDSGDELERLWTPSGLAIAALLLSTACTPDGGRGNDEGSGIPLPTAGTDSATGDSGTGGSTDPDGTDSATEGPMTAESGDETTVGDEGMLQYIEVSPANTVLELDLDTPTSQDFTVTGWYSDGSSADLTDVTTWSHSNPMLGAMNGATLEVPGYPATFVGSTLITAEADGFFGNAQVTVAAYRQTGEQPDFFFVLPFNDPAGPQQKPLTFSTDVKSMDVFVMMDTTGSMGGPIGNLQSSLGGTVIPGIQAAIPDTQFGVGAFEDFPISPFGSNPCFSGQPDQPFELLQAITPVVADVQTGVNALTIGSSPIGCGNDWPESSIEGMYQVATGDGLAGPAPTSVPANHAGVGGVEFRQGSMPVIVSITDAPSHDPGNVLCYGGTDYDNNASVLAVAHTRQQTEQALADICARVVTVAVNDFDSCGPYGDGLYFAQSTGTAIPPDAWDLAPGGRPASCAAGMCCTGLSGAGVAPDGTGMCPLVYRAASNGSGVGTGMVDGVSLLASYSPFDVTTEVDGVDTDIDGAPLPAGYTTADFIVSVTPFDHGPLPLPGVPPPTLTATAFENVIPNTDVTFTIEAYNDFVPQLPVPQLFSATIRVLADGCSDLDERTVIILVPPEDLPPPG